MMRKIIYITLIFTLISSYVKTQHVNSTTLKGQRWIFNKEINSGGFGFGNSWTFLPNNRFTETEWYVGGAYYTHQFSGIYHYKEDSKTVFLRYTKNLPI